MIQYNKNTVCWYPAETWLLCNLRSPFYQLADGAEDDSEFWVGKKTDLLVCDVTTITKDVYRGAELLESKMMEMGSQVEWGKYLEVKYQGKLPLVYFNSYFKSIKHSF